MDAFDARGTEKMQKNYPEMHKESAKIKKPATADFFKASFFEE